MHNILVVEDDAKLNRIACECLGAGGYNAIGVKSANEAFSVMYNSLCDLIISDISMPVMDGFEFAESVRAVNGTVPILFMSARDDFMSKQRGFRLGIDDYMVKPVNMDELVLRVGALLRRADIMSAKRLEVGVLVMDADAVSVTLAGEEVPVTTREFNILFKLLSYPNKAFTRRQLIDEFWDADSETTLRAVDVYITKLRDKFSGCADFRIVTIHGLGYKAVIG